MAVRAIEKHVSGEQAAVEEMIRDGFAAETKAYQGGRSDPHHHEYDVCLYVLEGEFRVTDVDAGTVHVVRPGETALVDRGTVHLEEHGPVKMVVGRRH